VVAASPIVEGASSRRSFHTEPPEALLARLGTDPARGLRGSEAQERSTRDGPNELPKPETKSAILQFLGQFTNPIVLTLLAAAVIALVDGASRRGEPVLVRFGDATAILLIVAVNAIIGFVQEQRAEAALAALEKMQTPGARVRRDNEVQVIAATLLVAGDIVELEAGDAVPADARLLQTINLFVEESSLTGESVPVEKNARAAVADDAPLGDRATMLFVGTNIIRGKGRAVVVATGPRTELGHLSALIHRPRDRTTPLEEKLDAFGQRILWACLALSGVLFARGMIHGDRTWHALLLEAVSLAVAAIPEGLPAITTITLALGMQRMAKRGAIIRKLAAVETLGAATVICSDKTGGLRGRHAVHRHRDRLRPGRRSPGPRGHRGRRAPQAARAPARDGGPVQQRVAAEARWRMGGRRRSDRRGPAHARRKGRRAARGDRVVGPAVDGAALRQRPKANDHRHARRVGPRGRPLQG
jgi:Ca2+-transporting ATPase